ncbi:MAG: TolC family protein, partial [Verrucomicrobiota bacterium]
QTLFQRQLGINVRQLLYDGGSTRRTALASENAMMAQQYLEKAMIESRTVDLAEVYMEMLRTEKQITLANENIANHQRMHSLISKKVDNGGHKTELSLAQSRLDRARHTLSDLELAYERSRERFTRLTGERIFALTYPKIPSLPGSIDAISVEKNWAYLAATEALEEAEHRADAMKSEHAPKFYVDAGYDIGRDLIGVSGRDNELSALIVGEWQLFNGGRKNAIERREHFQVGKYEELKRAADIARKYDVNLLWQERQASQRSVNLLSKYQGDLAGVVSDYEQRFTLGREDLLNILDTQAELYQVKSDLVNSEYDYDTSVFRIMGKQGELAEWLLRLEGKTMNDFAQFQGKNPVGDPIPVALPIDETLKDERVPLTQVELMKEVFDGEGPTDNYEPSLRETHYGDNSNSRKTFFKNSPFRRKDYRKATHTPQTTYHPEVELPASATANPIKKKFQLFKRK